MTSNVSTPALQDKSLFLVIATPFAGLLSAFLAKKLGLAISEELIMQLVTALSGVFVALSKGKQVLVARAEANANAAQAVLAVSKFEDAAKALGAK